MKQGKRINWFDVVTTMWALALVVAAVMWVSTPAFARGGDGPDCVAYCIALEKCEGAGGCMNGGGGGGDCYGECGDGSSWECGYAL